MTIKKLCNQRYQFLYRVKIVEKKKWKRKWTSCVWLVKYGAKTTNCFVNCDVRRVDTGGNDSVYYPNFGLLQ